MPSKNGINRLYHSNVNLPRSVTQYEITKNLGKSLENLPKFKTIIDEKKKSLAYEEKGERLSLLLPHIEPDCDLDLSVNVRDASASYISTPENRENRARSSDKSNDEALDYLTNYDDDNDTAKSKLHKLGIYEMEHNWILHETLEKNLEDFKKKGKKLEIPEPDYESKAPVTDRLKEIRSMLKPRAELGDFMSKMDPVQREKIWRIAHMDPETLKQFKSQEPRETKAKIQEAVRFIIKIIQACNSRKKYYKADKPNTAATLKRMKKSIDKEDPDNYARSSIGFDVRLSLITSPEFRTVTDLKRIAWVLRATKAFKNLFPIEVETELARVVAYERYDANRVISYQGRDPERFYYILTGKIQKVKEYRLTSGIVSRNEGFIEKGTTTDVDDLEENWPRDHHLVSSGQVEVLIIHRDDFLRLRNRTQGPPIEFLRSLDLFMEFPVEVFINNQDAIDLRYYGQNIVICDDSNRTPWIYIVKSGKVKVVRIQTVVNTEQDNKLLRGTTEELGCVRSSSHADAMFGNLNKQRRMKALRSNTFSLPEINDSPEQTFQFSRSNSFADGMNMLAGITKRLKPAQTQDKKPVSADPKVLKNKLSKSKRSKKQKSAKVTGTGEEVKPDTEIKENQPTEDSRVSNPVQEYRKEKMFPPIIIESPINTPVVKLDIKDDSFKPHGTYLTREKTEFDPVYSKRQKRDTQSRRAYLQLDLLRSGDIFGLEHLHPTMASEPKGVSLVSDGAEVIRISKRFFLLHAKNNTMLRVETMHREYMNPEEARDSLYTAETWNQYKSEIMKRMVSALSSRA
ncbi:uncharacterized protein LOC143042879 isoform X2 [Mytilus galloprovincialis]|uniref:uncharacterized protein LOC143042879 isoform X2 n=1 Tax=Mytilus galloprovincialis TaxID=29158 RepID=UPI003F7BC00D